LVKKILVGLFSIAFLFSFSMNNVSAEPSEDEAIEKAQSLADNQQVSKEDLYDILKAEDYSDDLAQYAVDNVEKDWKENALDYADSLRDQDYSEDEVERHLDLAKFTEDEIQYALGDSDDSDEEDEDSENNDESEDDEGTNDENEENNENDDKNNNDQDESDENQDDNADEQESADNNDDNQQAEESTENDAADNNNDEEDEAAAVASDDGSDDEEGGRLPDTATSTFNWMLVGGASLAAGGLGVFLTRKKKAAAQK